MSFSINGKTAIVTGAANGVGLAIARQFVEAGANVMFADMDEERLKDEVAKEAETEGAIQYFAGDLRERLTIANLLSATLDAFDEVDILVNGSRQIALSEPRELEDTTVELLLEQNVLAALRLSQLVSRRMVKQNKGEEGRGSAGSIINLSSIAAKRTLPELLAYSVSSAALDQMTRSLAVALAPDRIRVNAIAFGSVMSASLRSSLEANEEFREDIKSHTPLGRIASATEVAEAAQFLASDGAGFMTGQILTLDGGRSLLDAVAAPAH